MKSGIYLITNTITKEVYVGQSQDVHTRLRKHKEMLIRKDKKANKHLMNSVNKHGIENFTFEPLLMCSIERLTLNEQIALDYFRETVGVYNKGECADSPMRGTKGLIKHSAETRQKQSFAKIGDKNPSKRKDVREKMKLSGINKVFSEKHLESLKSASRKKRPERFRQIERIDLFTGEIKIYESIKSTKLDGFQPSCVGRCCKNISKTHKGFAWIYMGDF